MATEHAHALVSVHDRYSTCTIYRHEHGAPGGPLGVIATMRQACRYLLRVEDFNAGHYTAALVSVWSEHGDEVHVSHEEGAAFDPRWWYEVDCIRERVCVTVHDLQTWGAQPHTYALTGAYEDEGDRDT